MSILFGVMYDDHRIVQKAELQGLARTTERYACDGTYLRAGEAGMGHQAFYTDLRSHLDRQPSIGVCGNCVTFDGRLDNHTELGNALGVSGPELSDSQIILLAFERWGEACFSKLIGDWALALWSASTCSLYLARDHAGTRSLYYEQKADRFQWSTYLETLVVDVAPQALDEDYLANYLACCPIRDRTPFDGIRSVLAGHVLKVHGGAQITWEHWQWMARETIRYTDDRQYEEHFFQLFRQAVERRTGPGSLPLAQLSGGMDSTSIVCMSDYIQRLRMAQLLDTVSYYDDAEPEWNEKPYFSLVESQRGKVGIHLESTYRDRTFLPPSEGGGRYLLPGADSASLARETRFLKAVAPGNYRVLLSGIGGDEVFGAALTGLPELGDYVRSGRLGMLAKQGLAWCLSTRKPLIAMGGELVRYTASLYWRTSSVQARIPPWVTTKARSRCLTATIEEGRMYRFAPSRVENGRAWRSVQTTLPHLWPAYLARFEYRYPCLDRDLVEYLFRIPREQLVRPGISRSLQTRSLKRLLPEGIIQRRRKAYAGRGLSIALSELAGRLDSILDHSIAIERNHVDRVRLADAIREISQRGTTSHAVGIVRFLSYEAWGSAHRLGASGFRKFA